VAAAPKPSIASGGVKFKPLNLLGDQEPAAPPPVTADTGGARPSPTPIAVAEAPVPTPAAPDAAAAPVTTPGARSVPAEPRPASPTRPTAVAAAPVPSRPAPPPAAVPAAPEPSAPAEAGLSARDRGLTPDNFDSLQVFLDRDSKSNTEEYRFVLRFKRPVNAEGLEECVVLSAKAVRGAPREFLPRGDTELLDPLVDPKSTSFLSFLVNASLALETPGVNHLVYLKVQIGNLPEAVFEGRTGVKAGKKVKE
jgi:hypothetical protein